ncbi:hypothetical protein [Actinoplanes friuliensis]|uniref:hypothetical protein n=1 Tax=Actinoplanes friuliensis TaxID=196914 RepID=UPI0003F5C628|nr:hypothetical protein [Actinoplanes friuliensis]
MEKTERAERPREDYRHLPPRILPDEMVPAKAVVQIRDTVVEGTDNEWHVRMGWAV